MPRNALRHDNMDLVVQLDSVPAVPGLLVGGKSVEDTAQRTAARLASARKADAPHASP